MSVGMHRQAISMAIALLWILVARVASSSLRREDPSSYVGKYMTDAGNINAKAEKRHEIGILKGEWLATLYSNCTVRYLDSQHIEVQVRAKAAQKANLSQHEIIHLDQKIKSATDADKVRDINGDSQYLNWIDKREDEEAEIEFYNQIISNAHIVQKKAAEGLMRTTDLEKKVGAEMEDLKKWDVHMESEQMKADAVYEEAVLLWKQWQDSSKDYSCGDPPVVDHAQNQCADGNTKYAIKCPITCEPGYDDPNDSKNKLRCRKMGKFGKQLYGEWRGYASCIGRLCGEPGNITKAKQIVSQIRFPHAAHYTCYEGYTQTGEPTGNQKFDVPCGTKGTFELNTTHECNRVKCGEAPIVNHTKRIEGTFFYSDEITYQCHEGYTLDETSGGLTSFPRTCQATGRFTVAQDCKRVRCGPPLQYDHTSLTTGSYDTDTYYGDEVKYECKPGYTTDQKPGITSNMGYTLKCGSQGELRLKGAPGTLSLPRCSPVCAGVPDEVPNGALERREMCYGQHVTVTAHSGYSTTGIVGDGISFLLSVSTSGTFEGLQQFKPVSCGAPPKVNNAATTFVGEVVVYGNALDFTCKKGYSTDSTADTAALSFQLQCEADGSMTRVPGLQECVNIDDCADHTCGPFGVCVDHLENYTCSCDSGYAQTWDNETDELTCGNIDDCGPDACGVGHCKDGVNTYSCECPSGYKVYVDVDYGETCTPKLCGTPPQISHAFTVPADAQTEKASYLDNIVYNCEHGYSLDGTNNGKKDFSIDCQASTQFSEQKQCLPIKCGKAPEIDHAAADPATVVYTEEIKYTCATGYTTDATAEGHKYFTIACHASGDYGPPSECMRINCGEPSDAPNAVRPAGSLLYDQSAEYKCMSGFSLTGKKDGGTSFSVKCHADGTLDEPKHCLAVECGHPPTFIHAKHATTLNEGVVRYPRHTQVTCRDGYTVGGTPDGQTGFNVACLASGEFEEYNKNNCLPVNCGAPPDIANSTLKEIVNEHGEKSGNQNELKYDTKAIYDCPVGFTAGGEPDGLKEIHVECLQSGDFSIPHEKMLCRNINDCELHTCGAKGKCVDLIGPRPAYTCNCDFGYEIQVDSDGEKHCGNTDDCKGQDCGIGTCKDLIGDYTCICPIGYYIGEINGKKTCIPVNCVTETPEVAFAKQVTQPLHTGPVNFPATLHYECDIGYSIDGTVAEAKKGFISSCVSSGDLVGLLSCQKISCGTPYVWPFTHLVSPSSATTSLEYEEVAKYRCHEGHTVGGAPTADVEFEQSCEASGHLTDPGVCEPVKCGEAPTVADAHSMISGDVYYGNDLVYKCTLGYTLDGTPSGADHFNRHCQKDGEFSEVSSKCKPISGGEAPTLEHADLVEYSGHAVTSAHVQVYYPHGFMYKCKPGYSETGMLGGATEMSTRVTSMGLLDPALPTGCRQITFVIRGQVKNSRNGQSLDGVTVRIEGTNVQTVTQGGYFTLTGVPHGDNELAYEKTDYIKSTALLTVHDDISAGGAADMSMSPKMNSDEWRAVVTWGARPTDLDTYAKWASKKVCWYGTRKYAKSIRGTLEHDDTNSYGPETLHLTGVGKCTGSQSQCDINYEINDYGRTGIMKNTDVQVILYTGETVAGTWKIKDCPSSVSDDGNWWHVFTLDGKQNVLKWNCKMGGHAPGHLGLSARRHPRKAPKKLASHASKARKSAAVAKQNVSAPPGLTPNDGHVRTALRSGTFASKSGAVVNGTETAQLLREMPKDIAQRQTKALRSAPQPPPGLMPVPPDVQKVASPSRLRASVHAHLF